MHSLQPVLRTQQQTTSSTRLHWSVHLSELHTFHAACWSFMMAAPPLAARMQTTRKTAALCMMGADVIASSHSGQ